MTNDISSPQATPTPAATPAQPRGGTLLITIAVVLALAAWCALMWIDGWTALVVAAASIVAGAFGFCRSSTRGMRRLATVALIAAIVLAVVDTAFLVVLRISLGT